METLSLVAMLLSLVPVFIILFRKAWQTDILNFLMVLCLLTFFQQLLGGFQQLASANRIYINAVFRLGEFIILLYLFRPPAREKWMRDIFNTCAIAFISVVITVYAIKGATAASGTIDALQALILLLAAALALVQLIRSGQLYIFQLPIFWIIAGSLCYFSIFLLLMMIPQAPGSDNQQEKMVFLAVIHSIRSVFFILAAAAQPKNNDSFKESV